MGIEKMSETEKDNKRDKMTEKNDKILLLKAKNIVNSQLKAYWPSWELLAIPSIVFLVFFFFLRVIPFFEINLVFILEIFIILLYMIVVKLLELILLQNKEK